jgi:hypothetical protein
VVWEFLGSLYRGRGGLDSPWIGYQKLLGLLETRPGVFIDRWVAAWGQKTPRLFEDIDIKKIKGGNKSICVTKISRFDMRLGCSVNVRRN